MNILTPQEVATMLGCEPKTIEEAARRGRLPGVKFGRSWRFPREALEEALRAEATAKAAKRRPTPVGVAMPTARASRRSPMPTLIDMR